MRMVSITTRPLDTRHTTETYREVQGHIGVRSRGHSWYIAAHKQTRRSHLERTSLDSDRKMKVLANWRRQLELAEQRDSHYSEVELQN